MNVQELEALLTSKEGAAAEFKEAKERYSFDELTDYCLALANERGGKYLMRLGDSLVPMSPEKLREIFAESGKGTRHILSRRFYAMTDRRGGALRTKKAHSSPCA